MTSKQVRQKFLDFFKQKEHAIIPSASLIPENDPTTLFISAGMHPLVPYLMGEKHPEGERLVSVQKCIRTIDIEEVGDTYHHTFFEMLGNWSLGDYFKKEAIEWSLEFLTKDLKIPVEKLAISVFGGDERVSQVPKDEEAAKIWESLGIPKERIAFIKGGVLESDNNWWGPAGQTGPCGPDTEMFYWNDNKNPAPKEFDPEDKRWVEIWNDVFMEYNKTEKGEYQPLSQKNVDTGMGLERTLAVMNNLDDDYKTELFWPIIRKIEEVTDGKYEENKRKFRIIADHIKASVFLLSDGVEPSNKDRGYVLRRLIRRAVALVNIDDIKFDVKKFKSIAKVVFNVYKDAYQEFKEKSKRTDILDKFSREVRKFRATIEKGLKEFEKGTDAFILFSTYGFPIETTQELAKEKGRKVDMNKFNEQMKKHQELSRTASAGKFKGGLADAGEETKKLHTAAHLLLAALRKVLGEHVNQKGSNITAERLRFDFSHPEKMTDEQKEEVEKIVNEVIKKDLPVVCREMSLDEAKKEEATGVFESKYGEKVKVYTIEDPSTGSEQVFSKEICGGPHVEKTGELGHFKITKEQSSSSGIRRIKAVLEPYRPTRSI